jgi:hypothetical protein
MQSAVGMMAENAGSADYYSDDDDADCDDGAAAASAAGALLAILSFTRSEASPKSMQSAVGIMAENAGSADYYFDDDDADCDDGAAAASADGGDADGAEAAFAAHLGNIKDEYFGRFASRLMEKIFVFVRSAALSEVLLPCLMS